MGLEKQIFTDCYNYLQRNIPPRDDQSYWADLIQQQTEIEQKYPGEQFARNTLKACTDRLCELYDKGA